MLDVFNNDAFGVVSLTQAIDILPLQQQRLGQLGIFQEEGIPTTVVAIERRDGNLVLIPAQPRGTMPEHKLHDKRKVLNLAVPHLPKNDTILADAVQNVRAFGSSDQLEGVSSVVNNRLERLKLDHETTWEWMRACALRGLVVDADASTVLYNMFTEFGVVEPNVNFEMATAGAVRTAIETVLDTIAQAMGSMTYTGIRAICNPSFFKKFVNSADVDKAYARYREGEFYRQDPRAGFEYGGIVWERYSATAGTTPYIPVDTCRFVVEGAPGLYQRKNAPGDFVETVNTVGQQLYAKQERMQFDKGILLHTQSNPLFFCSRPEVLVKGTATEPAGG